MDGDDFVLALDSGLVADQAPECDGQGDCEVVRNDLLDSAALHAAVGRGHGGRGGTITGVARLMWPFSTQNYAKHGASGEKFNPTTGISLSRYWRNHLRNLH